MLGNQNTPTATYTYSNNNFGSCADFVGGSLGWTINNYRLVATSITCTPTYNSGVISTPDWLYCGAIDSQGNTYPTLCIGATLYNNQVENSLSNNSSEWFRSNKFSKYFWNCRPIRSRTILRRRIQNRNWTMRWWRIKRRCLHSIL